MFTIIKILISAMLIGIITMVANRYPTYGGIVAALPLVSILSMIWLHVAGEPLQAIGQFAIGVLKGLPATMVMMLIIGIALQYSVPLIFSLMIGVVGWAFFLFLQDIVLGLI
ncbi:hypothetical protein BTS2_2431 [Bacillus sp. TS-2]|nr:hypothetical protein BTS2_2431 [Bacillus sp. TS-2]